jgi:biotin transporter BioY
MVSAVGIPLDSARRIPVEFSAMTSRPSVSHASTILDQVSMRAASANAWTGVQLLSVLFVAVLTAAAAQLSFPLPFTPVPFTIQPMIVLIGAAALGSRLGALSQIIYLMLGIAGFQAFAHSPDLPQGFARLLGPTGGYLMAYPLAAFATGLLAERGFDRR